MISFSVSEFNNCLNLKYKKLANPKIHNRKAGKANINI